MKVIVAGSRDVCDSDLVRKAISDSNFPITELICGMAKGVDLISRNWAVENKIPVAEFPADWNDISVDGAVVKYHGNGSAYNVKAGVARNQKMADYAKPDGALIAIRKNNSRGTTDMIERAKTAGLKIFVLDL